MRKRGYIFFEKLETPKACVENYSKAWTTKSTLVNDDGLA